MQDLTQRHIPLKGASNFRDLGGYVAHAGRRVKWRTIFRSDHLANLEPEDLTQLQNLGVQRAFDFRGVEESQAQAYAWPQIKRLSLSIEPTVVQRLQAQYLTGKPLTAADALDAMQTTYRDFVKTDSNRFAQLFEHLLDQADPLLFHCTAGKDRTGLLANCPAGRHLQRGCCRNPVLRRWIPACSVDPPSPCPCPACPRR